jgi:hypothetical protein
MIKKIYAANPFLEKRYSKKLKKEIELLLEEEGFEYQPPGLGAGPGDVLSAVAYLNIKTNTVFWIITLNIISNVLYDLLKRLRFILKDEKKDKRPIIYIYVYRGKKCITNRFYLDKDYSKKEIKQTIIKNLKVNK